MVWYQSSAHNYHSLRNDLHTPPAQERYWETCITTLEHNGDDLHSKRTALHSFSIHNTQRCLLAIKRKELDERLLALPAKSNTSHNETCDDGPLGGFLQVHES